ncbi:hypothetical protein ACQ4PT_020832 [Festuca glaucescens]
MGLLTSGLPRGRAHHLFDEMSDTHRAEKVLVPSDTDWISALPDGVLGHILGFLPADEAVRTCVLSRRWLHQWKFMRRLRVTSHGVWKKSADGINKFISSLLLLRDPGAALDEVELEFTYEPSGNDVASYPNIWIRHALLRQARALSVTLCGEYNLVFNVPPLVSRHLRKLQLSYLDFNGNVLDFSSCPSLEVLDMTECIIGTSKISSHSVKRLSIQYCSFCHDVRTRISVPSLADLQLASFHGKAPMLETNTSLKTAFVSPCSVDERCQEGDSKECCGTCAKCCGNDDDHRNGCVLLGGLSSATHLKLITESPGQVHLPFKFLIPSFIFRRDLKWCPTFVKLKKLFLDDWCVEADLRALVCMLEHSPILEQLTLQLSKGPERTLEREQKYGLMEKSTSVSQHLKMVNVKCHEVDQRVSKILKFLSTFDIDITIEKNGQIIPFEEVVTNFGLSLEVPPHDQSGVQD